MLDGLCSGGALQRCHHVADLHREPRDDKRTRMLERSRWEVMDPYKGLDSLAWRQDCQACLGRHRAYGFQTSEGFTDDTARKRRGSTVRFARADDNGG